MIFVDLCDIFQEFHVSYTQQQRVAEDRLSTTEYPKKHNALQCSLYRQRKDKEPQVQTTHAAATPGCHGRRFMKLCTDALSSFDNTKWQRSFHQKQFHDNFLRASARVFFKTSPSGAFNRGYQHILRDYNWEHLAQEILVSTPRRFGKTISVSMFAAAMIYSAPNVEVSIYSTCKRISQKLLRNVYMFLSIIHENMNTAPYKVIRSNMEEIVMHGPEGKRDVRTINSYPSKVTLIHPSFHFFTFYIIKCLFFRHCFVHLVKRAHAPHRVITDTKNRLAPDHHTRIPTAQDT
jgi:hypothetical protein